MALSGATVFGVGFLVVLDPASADALPIDAAVEALGFDYLLVAIVGVLALVVTLVVLALRAIGGLDQATPPSPEEVETVPRFGADVDAIIEDGIGLRARVFGDEHERIRERFRETAVQTVMRVSNCSRAVARERVAEGTWTDDPEAAAFLVDGDGGDGDSGGGAGTWRTRLLSALSGETPGKRGVRRSAEAIVAYADGGEPNGGRKRRVTSGSDDDASESDAEPAGTGSTPTREAPA